jgi:hypothetical protein
MFEIKKKITKYNQSNENFVSKGIILHSTGNGEDNVAGNFNYFNTAHHGSNAHFFVDSEEIAQFVETWNKAWHARNPANELFWGIEMCETKGSIRFRQIWTKTLWLVCELFTKVIYPRVTTISIDNLRSHHEENEINHHGDPKNHVDVTPYFKLHNTDMNSFRYAVQKAIDEICFNMIVNNKLLIKSPQYWIDNCKTGSTVNSSHVRQVILNFTAIFKILNTTDEVVDYLAEIGVVRSPDYWKRICKLNNMPVSGMNTKWLFSAMGKKLI